MKKRGRQDYQTKLSRNWLYTIHDNFHIFRDFKLIAEHSDLWSPGVECSIWEALKILWRHISRQLSEPLGSFFISQKLPLTLNYLDTLWLSQPLDYLCLTTLVQRTYKFINKSYITRRLHWKFWGKKWIITIGWNRYGRMIKDIKNMSISICVSVRYIHPSIDPSVHPSVDRYIGLSVCQSVSLSTCLSVCLSICFSIYLQISQFTK